MIPFFSAYALHRLAIALYKTKAAASRVDDSITTPLSITTTSSSPTSSIDTTASSSTTGVKLTIKLNFDVNKTILMYDSAESGNSVTTIDSVKTAINSIIAYKVWGRFDASKDRKDRNIEDFTFVSESAFDDRPSSSDGCVLIHFAEFVYNYSADAVRNQRGELLHSFTDIFPRFKKDFDRAMNFLKFQPSQMAIFSSSTGSSYSCSRSKEHEYLKHLECYSLLPSFFEVIKFVEDLKERSNGEIDYQIIFRTFGTDADLVAKEFNSICDLTHPFFKLDRNIEERKCYLPDHSLVLIRHGDVDDHVRVIRIKSRDQNSLKLLQRMEKPGNFSEIMAKLEIESKENGHHTWCFQDDYKYWNETCKKVDNDNIDKNFPLDPAFKLKGKGGKIMLVMPHELESDSEIASLFFDDNIEFDNANIVDCRLVIEKNGDDKDGKNILKPLDWKDCNNKFLFMAHPLQAIEDKNYYVDIIKKRIRGTHPKIAGKLGIYSSLFE